MNYATCEFCGERFTLANPNMGTHRDYHGECQTQAVNEGVDISVPLDREEPYQLGMEIED